MHNVAEQSLKLLPFPAFDFDTSQTGTAVPSRTLTNMRVIAPAPLVLLNAALTHALPQFNNPTVANINTTHLIALQNTTSVFPTPSHAQNTSSTEFRIFLSFSVFEIVVAALLLLYLILLFALHLRGRKTPSSDSTDSQAG